MDATELVEGVRLHGCWMRSEAGGQRADLQEAYLQGADLQEAYLRGAKISWSSHAMISEILWRAADTEARQMLAAFVGRMTDWCWDQWAKWDHPEREWAIAELRKWVQDGDGAPDLVRIGLVEGP